MTNEQIREMSEQQLRDLNHRIVEELRWRVSYAARSFRPGDRVKFQGRDRLGRPALLVGTVQRVNRQTVSVAVTSGTLNGQPSLRTENWRVSPKFLQLA